MMPDGKYTKRWMVTSYDADKNRRLKTSSIMKYMQETGEEQLRAVEMGYSELYNMGIIFVMTKFAVRFHKALTLADAFDITTWHRGAAGVQFFREYKITDAEGNLCAEAATAWVMIDPVTGKIKKGVVPDRMPAVDEQSGIAAAFKERFSEDGAELLGERVVRFSDIDYNNHVNNTVYIDIATDFVPKEFLEKGISEASIFFVKENRLGSVLKISGKSQDNTVSLLGENQEGKSFTAQIKFNL